MDYYDQLSTGYNELYGDEQRAKFTFVKDWLAALEGQSLDVGAGTGLINEFYAPTVLLDSSFGMLSKAKGVQVVADARFLPFKDQSFDNITCFTVLQDIINKKQVIAELVRVVRDKILITVLKKLKSREELTSLFKGLTVLDYREEEKDHCFLLSKIEPEQLIIVPEKEVKEERLKLITY
ncbi:MAG: class I SAM-dependent methyltransferase [Candidatus Nanoarchaeia archaeon]|jgi:ubiquinone/menaquinone biosynthesis C-methylase UbiE